MCRLSQEQTTEEQASPEACGDISDLFENTIAMGYKVLYYPSYDSGQIRDSEVRGMMRRRNGD